MKSSGSFSIAMSADVSVELQEKMILKAGSGVPR